MRQWVVVVLPARMNERTGKEDCCWRTKNQQRSTTNLQARVQQTRAEDMAAIEDMAYCENEEVEGARHGSYQHETGTVTTMN